jgi:hypothetical protein
VSRVRAPATEVQAADSTRIFCGRLLAVPGPPQGRNAAIDGRSRAVIYCIAKGVVMKSLVSFSAVILLGLSGLMPAQAQINMPNPMSPGMSPSSAVRLVANNDIMVEHFIHRWLQSHYPDWTAEPYEYSQIGPDRYAVVYISTANEPSRKVYFRVQQHPMDDGESPWPSR